MIIYNEGQLNTIFNDPNFLSNYDVYKKDSMDKIDSLINFLNDLDINKNYHKCTINKNKKYLTPESLKIKNINILLNKYNKNNIDNIKKEISSIILDDKDIIILVIDNILEKCIIQIQYIPLYLSIVKDLIEKCDYDIFNKCSKMKLDKFKNNNFKKDYDGLCDYNKNIDDCIGLCMLILNLQKQNIVTGMLDDMINTLFNNIIIKDNDICYKYISCLYNIFYSIDDSYILKYDERLKALKDSKISKKNKFKIMDILEMV